MGLYVHPDKKETTVIHIKEIDELAHNIKKYVDTYYANIYITDQEDLQRLDRLNSIADALLQRRFNGIFEPTVEIDYGHQLLFEIPF